MNDVVIRAEGLGKAYQIRHEAERRHDRFSEMLTERARRLFRRNGNADPTRETFWALRDVSFEIREGEVVGIIGRNGAGKSTLLKVLSRITEPTEGRVEIQGRVASLLEVGTGFHPELTGRENVYLNGAILGMSRAEIRRKFDEIVDFAGVEKFLDTPVKRYSSGMRVRLAFAVAAHLEPEILIVDEVLAVGDAEFQQKCLGKMGEVAGHGRTVLFVSHNMLAIKTLCRRAILLDSGNKVSDDEVDRTVNIYLQGTQNPKKDLETSDLKRIGEQGCIVDSLSLFDSNGNKIKNIQCGQRVTLRFTIKKSRKFHSTSKVTSFGVSIFSSMTNQLIYCGLHFAQEEELIMQGLQCIDCTFPKFPLTEGTYRIRTYMEVDSNLQDQILEDILIDVSENSYFGTSKNAPKSWIGNSVLVDHNWMGIYV